MANGTIRYYTGYTSNIKRRFQEHKNGHDKKSFTHRAKGNIELVYLEEIHGLNEKELIINAKKREKQIKPWTQARKEKLIKIRQQKTSDLINKYFQN